MNPKNVIKTYKTQFNEAFNVPDMLSEIKTELTFTPRIIFKKRVKIRLILELMTSFIMVFMSTLYLNQDFDTNPISFFEENKSYILLGIATLAFLLFIIDMSHKLIQVRKKALK
jgi:hypothetical protein